MTDETIFTAALEQPDPAERAAYLDSVCKDDPTQRKRIDGLLAAHAKAVGFLERPAVAPPAAEATATRAYRTPEAEVGDGETRTQGELADADTDDALSFLKPAGRPDSLGRLGHYEVLEVLGTGGFGIVYRAFDEVLQRVVAVKVLAPSMAATSPARKRFIREAQSAARIQHENVVRVHDVSRDDERLPYLVMEFISGETLQQTLDRKGPLEVPEVVRIGRQIADGLAAAHEKGLIHRDIKPSNILIDRGPQDHAKITDFGLARAADDASLTRSGVVAGTPMYMAPEQARGESLDHRADLFSLGSVLYAMLTGRPPFRAETTLAVLKRVAEDTPRPIREIIPEVPEWLCRIVEKLHAKNPAGRFQTAKEVAEVLADCEAQLQAHRELRDYSRIPGGAPAPAAPWKLGWPAAVAAALLLPVPATLLVRWTQGHVSNWVGLAAAAVLALAGLVGAAIAFNQTVYLYATNRGELILDDAEPQVEVTILQRGTVIHDRSTQRSFVLDADPATEIRADMVTAHGRVPMFRKDFAVNRGGQVRVNVAAEFAAVEKLHRDAIDSGKLDELGKSIDNFKSQVEGFVPLFNGTDLTGWHASERAAGRWRVADGVLVGDEGPGFLFTEGVYRDFHLRVEARVNAGGNGGVNFRDSLQAEISGQPKTPSGSLVRLEDKKAVSFTPYPHGAVPADTWFTLEVRAAGPKVEVRVNNLPWTTADAPGDGQAHRIQLEATAGTVVQFRKIEIKELPPLTETQIAVARGWDLVTRSEYDEARKHFAQALARDPNHAEAHAGLGCVAAAQKNIAEAERHAAQALLHGAGDYLILHNVACIYAMCGVADPNQAAKYQDMAMDQVRRGVELWKKTGQGPDPLKLIQSEPWFPPAMRNRPDFRTLMNARAPAPAVVLLDREDLAKLKGEWLVRFAEHDGNPLARKKIDALEIRFGDGEFEIRQPTTGQKSAGPFRIDAANKQLFLHFKHSPVPVRCAYRIDDDRLRLTFGSWEGKKPVDAADLMHLRDSYRTINNLKQLGIAMHNYNDQFGGLPRAASTNAKAKDGKPLSWRVALLPYIEDLEADLLYKQFRLDEPWDSEHNKKLIDKMPAIFATPGGARSEPGLTHYRVFTGPGTVFEPLPPNREFGVPLGEAIKDGPANTLLIVEAADPVIWTKPDDLPYDPKQPLPKLGATKVGIPVAMCDGSIGTLAPDVSEKALRALITRSGGEMVSAPFLKPDPLEPPPMYLECVRRGPVTDKERLQGLWVGESAESLGLPLPADRVRGMRLEFTGANLRVTQPGKPDGVGTFKLDADANPKEIDAIRNDDEKGMRGIYRLDGDKLTVCMGEPGPNRPREFRTGHDTGPLLLVTLRRATPAEQWVPLFNGKDLTGWKPHKDAPGTWKVEGDVLVGRGPALLFSEREDYRDFHYRIEARVVKGAGKQLFRYTCGPAPRYGYQAYMHIYDWEAQTGSLTSMWKGGGGAASMLQKVKEKTIAPDTWFTQEVIASGPRITVVVDGKTVAEWLREPAGVTDHALGGVGLEVHENSVLQVRKIEVKELPASNPPASVAPAPRPKP